MQTLLNQLIYFSFFQSILLLSIYVFSAKSRRKVNSYLAFFVAILAVGLMGRIGYISGIAENNYRWVIFSEMSTLLFGVTIYLFTQSSLFKKPFTYSDLLHYVPALIYNAFLLFFLILPTDEELQRRIVRGEQLRTTFLFIGTGLAFNISYWVMSLRIFLKFRKEMQTELSYEVQSDFFLNFLIAIGLCLFSWLSMYFLGFFWLEILDRSVWQVIWLSIAIIILVIAFYVIKEPELFKVQEVITTQKYAQSKFSMADLERLSLRLEQIMEEKKPYLNNRLLKAELASMLGVSNPELARLLNEKIGMNFFEYVNYYRIKEFVALAKTDKAKSYTLFGLAQEAGFNSKTTFNKSFKKLMGTSPSKYFVDN